MLKQGWRRFRDRVEWSWQGWAYCWKNEPSLRQWFVANIISATLAMLLELTPAERALVLALGILVFAAELMNTSIEKAVDYISTERHPLAKIAKDTASAAVVLTAIATGVAWLVILLG